MMGFLSDISLLYRGWRSGFIPPPFIRPADYPDPIYIPPVVIKEPDAAPAPKAKAIRQTSVSELKRDVLDNLKAYQIYINRLRKADPEAYGMYRRTGAFILPPDMTSNSVELEPGVLAKLPSFGAICLGCERDSDPVGSDGLPMIPIRFATMMKLTKPGAYVERRNDGVIYRCALFWDDVKDKNIRDATTGVFREYMVHVGPCGTVTPLRVKKAETQVIRHRRTDADVLFRKGGNQSVVTHQRWGLPDIGELKSDETMADRIRVTFCLMMNFWAQAATQSMIRVTAEKGSVIMPFVVDVLDTPAFFADRNTVIDIAGHKKRIFHVVRPHIRANGQSVKMHFRGLRSFLWNGYSISITVPGKWKADITELTAGAHEDEDVANLAPGFIPIEELADRVADMIN